MAMGYIQKRRAAAQAAFEAYDFGGEYVFEDADDWRHLRLGREWVRSVRFTRPCHLIHTGSFTVLFSDPWGAKVEDAAAWAEGVRVGKYIPGASDALVGQLLDLQQMSALEDLVRDAAVPGGIGPHEFSRPGGWLHRAEAVLDRIDSRELPA